MEKFRHGVREVPSGKGRGEKEAKEMGRNAREGNRGERGVLKERVSEQRV